MEASLRKANADNVPLGLETPLSQKSGKKRKKVSAKKLPDPSTNPRKVMALGADVSGLGNPAAGRAGLKRKVPHLRDC